MAFTASCAYCDVTGDTLPLRLACQCNLDGKVPRDITNCLNHYDEKQKIKEERKGDDLVKVQLWFNEVSRCMFLDVKMRCLSRNV
jgi:hypothetical protein